jgi:hypothetical protein
MTFCSEVDAVMETEPLEDLLLQVDSLFNGTSEDKSLAYQILHERRNKVLNNMNFLFLLNLLFYNIIRMLLFYFCGNKLKIAILSSTGKAPLG